MTCSSFNGLLEAESVPTLCESIQETKHLLGAEQLP